MKKFVILDVYQRPTTMVHPPFREDILSAHNYLGTRIRSALVFNRVSVAHRIKIVDTIENKLYFIGTVKDALDWCKGSFLW